MKIILEMKHEIEDHLLSFCCFWFSRNKVKHIQSFLHLATNYAIDVDAKKASLWERWKKEGKKPLKQTHTHLNSLYTPTRSFVIKRCMRILHQKPGFFTKGEQEHKVEKWSFESQQTTHKHTHTRKKREYKTLTHEEVDVKEKEEKKERFWPGKLPKKKMCTFLSWYTSAGCV